MDNHDLLENYFENAIIPQLYIDRNLILRKFTPPAMKQFTLSKSDIGKSIHDLINNIRFPSIVDNINEVLNSQIGIEKEIQTTDLRWFQMNIIPFLIRSEKRTDGAILTFVDITKRIATLKDLQKLYSDHTIFAYSVSHDIRQPLSTINVVSTALQEAYKAKDDNLFQISIDLLQRNLSSVTKIIDSLAANNSKKVDFSDEKERINIEDIWEDVTLSLKDDIYTCGAKIITHFDASEITFSRINLRSIIYNLLSNSIKYRQPDIPLEIKVSTQKTEGYVLFTITDNGIGIDRSNHDTIFEECMRVSSQCEGTGIGLFLVSSMLKNNNGKITVESSLGNGTTFRVYFSIEN